MARNRFDPDAVDPDIAEYLPSPHATHFASASTAGVSDHFPAPQSMHFAAASSPAASEYLPRAQGKPHVCPPPNCASAQSARTLQMSRRRGIYSRTSEPQRSPRCPGGERATIAALVAHENAALDELESKWPARLPTYWHT